MQHRKSRPVDLLNIYRVKPSFVVRVIRIKNGKKQLDLTKSFNPDKIGSTKQARQQATVFRDKVRKEHPCNKRSGGRKAQRARNLHTDDSIASAYVRMQMRTGMSRWQASKSLADLLTRSHQ